MTTFESLDLIEPIQRAVAALGYTSPTPIQAQAIPPLLEGRDVLGCAQTGSGKTAAFALPVLQRMANTPVRGKRRIRTLVLSPTRELAAQIEESFSTYGRYVDVKHMVMFGGVKENPQIAKLRNGVDVLVATPGRLLDLLGRGFVKLDAVEFFILDEADRMLDMGFIHDIRKVLAVLPKTRQNLLFSATMPPDIARLAETFMHRAIRVEVAPPATTVELIQQRVMFVSKTNKRHLLADLIGALEIERTLVFTRTKHGANRLVKQLGQVGILGAAIHGNKSQGARTRALDGFKAGKIPVLVATDIASRGIDVEGITHVFNFDLPNEPESYVHRIGRTGRAGRGGMAISFCDAEEGAYLRDIEKLIGQKVPVVLDHEYHEDALIPSARPPRPPAPGRGGRRGGGGGGHGGHGGGEHRRPQQRRGGRSGGSGRSGGGGGRSSGGGDR